MLLFISGEPKLYPELTNTMTVTPTSDCPRSAFFSFFSYVKPNRLLGKEKKEKDFCFCVFCTEVVLSLYFAQMLSCSLFLQRLSFCSACFCFGDLCSCVFLYRDGSVFVFCTDIVLRVFGSEVILFVCRCLFVFKGCCEYFVLMFFLLMRFVQG